MNITFSFTGNPKVNNYFHLTLSIVSLTIYSAHTIVSKCNRMHKYVQQSLGNQTGFTLVELILVILIVAITSFIVVPKFTTAVDSIKLDNARHKLADDIRHARHYAIDHHDTTWVVLNVADNNYGIYVGSTDSDLELITDPQTNTQHLIDFDDADFEGVDLTAVDFNGTNRFYFNYWGEPSQGGTITLNQITTITVTQKTGHVAILD